MRRLLRRRIVGVLPRRRDASRKRESEQRELERRLASDSGQTECAAEAEPKTKVATRFDDRDDHVDSFRGRLRRGRQWLDLP